MNFGKNLQNLRKNHNLSQEELADQLNVSRQAISKWESGAGLPEMDKLLQLCEMFNCKMDDLVRGELKAQDTNLKTVYDRLINRFSIWISLAIGLIILGTAPLIFAAGLGAPATDYGLVVLLIFVAIAVPILVTQGIKLGNFKLKHPKLEISYSEAEIDAFNTKFAMLVAGGIGTILVGLVIFMALMVSNVFGTESPTPVAIYLVFIAIAVSLFVFARIRKSKYNLAQYNRENSPEFIQNSKKVGTISGVIMMTATMIYLGLGFLCRAWDTAWIVFPLGGILCGIVSTILNHNQ